MSVAHDAENPSGTPLAAAGAENPSGTPPAAAGGRRKLLGDLGEWLKPRLKSIGLLVILAAVSAVLLVIGWNDQIVVVVLLFTIFFIVLDCLIAARDSSARDRFPDLRLWSLGLVSGLSVGILLLLHQFVPGGSAHAVEFGNDSTTLGQHEQIYMMHMAEHLLLVTALSVAAGFIIWAIVRLATSY